MDAKTYSRTDRFEMELYVASNPLAQGIEAVETILDAIDAHASELTPDLLRAGESSEKYTRANVRRRIKAQERHFSIVGASLSLVRSSEPEVLYSFDFKPPSSPVGLFLWLVSPFAYFKDANHADKRSRAFVALVRAVSEACHPIYAWGHNKADFWLGDDPHKESMMAPKQIYEVYWLNYYGPSMVEEIGRDRVLSTPAVHIETASDGGVLLLSQPTPVNYDSGEARRAQARALAHLRDDLSFEMALERLQRRSARLAPVERKWDPDVEPLLELTLDDVPYAERQEETARLNAYRPPEVREWRTVDDLLHPDVADSMATIDRYGGLYAEQLASLLRKEVPQVMQAGPDSLPLIDYHFWHFDYPAQYERAVIESDLAPAVGAYLGEVVVRTLGGRWVPRKTLDEAQVVVGDRAWLPFLRARHYLQSRQAILDYSLTKFYRTVQRYAEKNSG